MLLIPRFPEGKTRKKWYTLGFIDALIWSAILMFFENVAPWLVGLFFPYKNLPLWAVIFIALLIGAFFIWLTIFFWETFISNIPKGKIRSKWFLAGFGTGTSLLIFDLISKLFFVHDIFTILSSDGSTETWFTISVTMTIALGLGITLGHGMLAPLGSLFDRIIGRNDEAD